MPAPRKYTDRPAPTVAERQRKSRAAKRADGMRLVQVWLTERQFRALQAYCDENGVTVQDAVQHFASAFAPQSASPKKP
jgi:NRPS condensation-like uncharacterized protein